jgi:hypothetical protein
MPNVHIEEARRRLAEIGQALDEGDYIRGAWQRVIGDADTLVLADRVALAPLVTDVSRKLHRRNGYPRMPFIAALSLECIVFAIGVWLVSMHALISILMGLAALALTLQPLIKVTVGLIVGVRYDYAFLWQVEPRFKMRYGTYFCLPQIKRVAFHASGALGTPLAMFVGYMRFLPVSREMAWGCLVFALGAAAMQVGAFVAEWVGVTRIAGLRLANVTSPATAAFELKRLLGR